MPIDMDLQVLSTTSRTAQSQTGSQEVRGFESLRLHHQDKCNLRESDSGGTAQAARPRSEHSRVTAIHATDRFQILALEGGGLKGLFAAAVLAALEKDLGQPLTDHFDLIAGTSAGGIIALGLGAGLTPRAIVEFYIEKGPVIFPDALHRLRSVRHLVQSKYGSSDLRAAVQEIFGDAMLGDSAKQLVVPAYNLDADEVYVFKTAHHEKLRRDYRVPLWEVAMATITSCRSSTKENRLS